MLGKATILFTGVLAAIVCTWGLWLVLQTQLLRRCNTSCKTFADFQHADPACIIDPTCVSPFYDAGNPRPQPWTGFAYWRTGAGQQHPTIARALALPNYLIFLLTSLVAAFSSARWIERLSVRWGLVVALYSWCALSILSWFVLELNPTWPLVSYGAGQPSPWLAMIFLSSTLALLSVATWLGRIAGRRAG